MHAKAASPVDSWGTTQKAKRVAPFFHILRWGVWKRMVDKASAEKQIKHGQYIWAAQITSRSRYKLDNKIGLTEKSLLVIYLVMCGGSISIWTIKYSNIMVQNAWIANTPNKESYQRVHPHNRASRIQPLFYSWFRRHTSYILLHLFFNISHIVFSTNINARPMEECGTEKKGKSDHFLSPNQIAS